MSGKLPVNGSAFVGSPHLRNLSLPCCRQMGDPGFLHSDMIFFGQGNPLGPQDAGMLAWASFQKPPRERLVITKTFQSRLPNILVIREVLSGDCYITAGQLQPAVTHQTQILSMFHILLVISACCFFFLSELRPLFFFYPSTCEVPAGSHQSVCVGQLEFVYVLCSGWCHFCSFGSPLTRIPATAQTSDDSSSARCAQGVVQVFIRCCFVLFQKSCLIKLKDIKDSCGFFCHSPQTLVGLNPMGSSAFFLLTLKGLLR